MDGGAWEAAVHGIEKSQIWLSDFTFTFHFYALEKEMATHSSVVAWRIPGTEEPGGLLSMGSHRVGHDCRELVAAAGEKKIWSSSFKLLQSSLFPLYLNELVSLKFLKIYMPVDTVVATPSV